MLKILPIFICLFASISFVDFPGAQARGFGGSRASQRARPSWGSAKAKGYTKEGSGSFRVESERSKGLKNHQASRGNPQMQRFYSSAKNGWGSGMSHPERIRSYASRYTRPTTAINPNYYGGAFGTWGFGRASVGIWDLFFLSTVSHLFWYHHWHDPALQKALYQQNLLDRQELARLEAKIKELESEKIPRDPHYLPDDVSYDVAYAKEHQEGLNEASMSAPKNSSLPSESKTSGWILGILAISVLMIYFFFVRRF